MLSLKNKGIGFYFTIVSCLLGLLTATIYAVTYANRIIAGQTVISWYAFAFLIIQSIFNLLLIVFKQNKFAPAISALLNGIALCFFIYGAYNYLAVVIVGIDTGLDSMFVIIALLFAFQIIINISNIFLKQEKDRITE